MLYCSRWQFGVALPRANRSFMCCQALIGTGYSPPGLPFVALQLLTYHVALLKGTDIDKPRNLAKSVIVE